MTTETKTKKFRITSLIVIIIFGLIITSFPILWMFGASAGKNYENRIMAQAPKLADMFLKYPTFSEDVEAYFNDNFPYRSDLVKAYSYLEFKVFDNSILPLITSKGKNNWLYYESYNTRASVNGAYKLSNKDLESIYNGIMAKYNYLNSIGKKYVVYLAPEKQMIYPEYDRMYNTTYTACDQLVEYLKEKQCPVPVIYGKDNLVSNKDAGQLYFKYDTHWNKLGAHYGYLEIINAIKSMYPDAVIPVADTFETTTYTYSGDLAGTLFLTDYLKETCPQLIYDNTTTYSTLDNLLTVVDSTTTSDINIFIYGDSFSTATYWGECFAQSASQVKFLHNANGFEKLTQYIADSDVIIEECVQRVPTKLASL